MTISGFVSDAAKYADYLSTFEGRLRLELTMAGLREFLPVSSAGKPRTALDVGCGTGAAATYLAQFGFTVTALDCSEAMLTIAQRAAGDARVAEKIHFRHGDVAGLDQLFRGEMFDVVLCHNVLEHVTDPDSLVQACAQLLKHDDFSVLSLLTRNRWGEVLKSALRAHDLDAADRTLDAEWAKDSLYGGDVRLFTPAEIAGMVRDAKLTTVAQRGVRVLAEYLPKELMGDDRYGKLLDLEWKLGGRPEIATVARYTHTLCKPEQGA